MGMASLLEKKCIIVTGKGGAGKSLLSLALAHRLSKSGKKVWLVEMGRRKDAAFTRLPELVGVKNGSHKPMEVKLPESEQKILLSVLDPTQSLAEYVAVKLPGGGLAGLLLNNRVTASFLEVVPGLPDLVSLGKLWYSLTQKKSVDVVVLDAPATGHALALLEAPKNFEKLTKKGPIYKDAAAMSEFFSDPKQTALVITGLPEEMALQETLELEEILKKNFPAPEIFINRCFPSLPAIEKIGENLPGIAYQYSRKRAEREQSALSTFPLPHHPIPFFFPDPESPLLYLRISESLC